jgi:hypothetical protein
MLHPVIFCDQVSRVFDGHDFQFISKFWRDLIGKIKTQKGTRAIWDAFSRKVAIYNLNTMTNIIL